MIDVRLLMPAAGSLGRLSLLAAALLAVAVACSNGDDEGVATAASAEPAATEAPAATDVPTADAETEGDTDNEPTAGDAASTAAALDFGSGTASITLGGESFELAIGPGSGICRDVFGIIQAIGQTADERDIEGGFMIPPLDWETYTDGRYDPPSVELEITSTGEDNARWRADAGWAQETDKVGLSQVDSYEKDGLTASGSATFANAWNSEVESVQGSFEISCPEG